MGELIQFRPRSKSDNPPHDLAPIEQMAIEIMNQAFPEPELSGTAIQAAYQSSWVPPDKDPA